MLKGKSLDYIFGMIIPDAGILGVHTNTIRSFGVNCTRGQSCKW